jgi:hypothetical protein
MVVSGKFDTSAVDMSGVNARAGGVSWERADL